MSSTRRTAFARKPRNPSAVSANKAERLQRVNKRFLDSLTSVNIEPEVSTILTKCDAKLSIEIGANGKGNYQIVTKAGEVIGDSADVQRIQMLGSFINAERKSVLRSTVSLQTQKTLAAMIELSREQGKEISKFPKSFLDVFRAIKAQMETLEANLASIRALTVTGEFNELVKEHMLEAGVKIRSVVGEYLMYRASLQDDEVPEKLNPRLTAAGIMIWTFTRLTAQKLQLGGKDFELRKIYFPKDPTKGLQITFREWNTPEVRNNQLGILDGCNHTTNLWTWENCRQFLGYEMQNLDLDQEHQALANVPLLVVPTPEAMTSTEILSILEKSGDRGFAWNMGLSSQPQDVLKFLGTVPKRVFLGALNRPALKLALIVRMFPGFQSSGDGTGIYGRLAIQAKAEGFDTSWFRKISSGTTDENVKATIVAITKDIIGLTEGPLVTCIRTSIIPMGKPSIGIVRSNVTDRYGLLMSATSLVDEDKVFSILSGKVEPTWFTRKKKAKELDFRNARCQIDTSGEELIKTLKMKRYIELSHRIEAWLRTFLSTRLQSAVAQVILAKLEASLSQPIKYGKEDHIVVLQPLEEDSSDDDDDEVAKNDNPDDV